jgi:hypothetical protein
VLFPASDAAAVTGQTIDADGGWATTAPSIFSCLVQLKVARDAPRLLGFAIYVWTTSGQAVQIEIAISATEASGVSSVGQHAA